MCMLVYAYSKNHEGVNYYDYVDFITVIMMRLIVMSTKYALYSP